MSDVTFDMANNRTEIHQAGAEPWRITLIDTGENTQTGGRLKRVRKFLENERQFCFTYGDGVADIDISALIAFHESHGKLATVTAIQPPGRYGALETEGARVKGFMEKPKGDGGWVNGGFFVLNPKAIDYIEGDASSWEGSALEQIAAEGELQVYKHGGFWQAMDTLRDKNHLDELWLRGEAKWKVWS
jgi:glucose-1-phosphate cytidylyltransferase